jgi:hypothetical protein
MLQKIINICAIIILSFPVPLLSASSDPKLCAKTIVIGLNDAKKKGTYHAVYSNNLAFTTLIAYERTRSRDGKKLAELGAKILEEIYASGCEVLAKEKQEKEAKEAAEQSEIRQVHFMPPPPTSQEGAPSNSVPLYS